MTWADALKKSVTRNRVRNDRIEKACLSNQPTPVAGFFESKLRCDTLKIFFEQYRSMNIT